MISEAEIVLRLMVGAVIGGVIGLERQVHGRPAGFRTHLLVCVATVLIMIVSEYYHHLSVMDPSYIRIDPARIAAGAITGVGFLGAGVILKMGTTVQGLTTAACIWVVSAIGLAVGGGLYLAGITSFAITMFSLLALRMVERRMSTIIFKVVTVSGDEGLEEEHIRALLSKHASGIISTNYERDVRGGEVSYTITFSIAHTAPLSPIVEEISKLKAVRKVSMRS